MRAMMMRSPPAATDEGDFHHNSPSTTTSLKDTHDACLLLLGVGAAFKTR